ncbi:MULTISPECIES: SDR family NAD(P)-dependent oxidoreductase [Marinovum]|uniref:SDR family NAD(P)-dependent oxidoreductase n=1 Tax=Marinovum TaxID=367771 RepID=UPI00237BC89B|nr:SDR family NAD(P)-dependent oxidoreductase [Marinovum sp. PR37]MDD9746422.1 SDR family NAD(P)-dependent oxidoreductase [Marinovum sp. PR37]
MRLENKIAIVIGAGQSPGTTVGNGRATCLLFACEGAKVVCVDQDLARAEETAAAVRAEGGEAVAVRADVTSEQELAQMVEQCRDTYGRIDILDYNVGISLAGGDAKLPDITEEAFDRVMAVNLRGNIMACKHVVPVMRAQGGGSIINISSLAAIEKNPMVAYKASKAGMVAFTEQLAITNAAYGVRANAVLPGLMDTPMAVDTRARMWGQSREEIEAARNKRVPLRNKMGTGWDVAYAALYLASDESGFVSGISLRVDGAAGVNVG